MNPLRFLYLFFIIIVLASCQKDEEPALENASIKSVSVESEMSRSAAQQIEVLIYKPNPCTSVSKINTLVSGTTYTYDIILTNTAQMCAQVIADEVVTVTFSPQATGPHILHFLINGRLYETRTVHVNS